MRLFVFGHGYSARAVVERMRPRLEAVWGTTRDPEKLAEIESLGVTPLLFDGSAAAGSSPAKRERRTAPRVWPLAGPRTGCGGGGGDPKLGARDCPLHHAAHGPPPPSQATGEEPAAPPELALSQADHVLVSIAPDESGEPVLKHFRDVLAAAEPRSLVYLSTIGVYGDHGGAWVDETSECRPVSQRSRQRLAAEQDWRRFGEDTGTPVAIIRLAGIYGPGRGPFAKIRRGTARRIVKPGQVFNRIHVDDIAAIVEAALLKRADGVFNGSDDEPAPPQDVLGYAAALLGVQLPPEVDFEDAELTPMARSFYGESKRVRNERIKRELGMKLAYPTYRDGLRGVHDVERRLATRL